MQKHKKIYKGLTTLVLYNTKNIMSEKLYKTPEYIRNAVKKYYDANSKVILEKNKNRYNTMSEDKKKLYLEKLRYARKLKADQNKLNETNEQKEIKELSDEEKKAIIKAKRHEYYIQRKLKAQQETTQLLAEHVDIVDINI